MLDNWYFGNPVNQRGQSNYIGSGYSIDRWKNINDNLTLTLNSDGITLTCQGTYHNICQYIENYNILAGVKVTVSALVTINSGSCMILLQGHKNGKEENLVQINAYNISDNDILMTETVTLRNDVKDFSDFYFKIGNMSISSSIKIKAVKLELGSEQTLCHNEGTEANPVWVLNEIPNYAEELAKCQRYFLAIGMQPYSRVGIGTANSQSIAYINAFTPVTMRPCSSVSYSGSFVLETGSTTVIPTNISRDASSQNCISLRVDAANLTIGAAYILRANNDASARVFISADL